MVQQRKFIEAPPKRITRSIFPKVGLVGANPCVGCPLEKKIKVPPIFPKNPVIVAVGMGPGPVEEEVKIPFQGESGTLLRASLRKVGLDPEGEVGYINLTRCRPDGDNFETPEWEAAQLRCLHYLTQDLRGWNGPLLLLGTLPLQVFKGEKRSRVTADRGMWFRSSIGGRECFVARHPAAVVRSKGEERKALQGQFERDLKRMVDRLRGKEQSFEIRYDTYPTLDKASIFLRKLGQLTEVGKFFFDIETYDGAQEPTRKFVGTDPFHPDFRVRGVAIATGPSTGTWIDFLSHEAKKESARPLLDLAFGGSAQKGAFNGGFDECGLIVPGWVARIRNRVFDPWLQAIALDQTGQRKSLDRLTVELLGLPQRKWTIDRSQMGSLPIESVAKYAVGDACLTWQLEEVFSKRLRDGLYL